MPKSMTWQDYQGHTQCTAKAVNMSHPATYAVMGLASEAGEVAGLWKKIMRDRAGIVSPKDRQDIKLELGDCLWYIAQVGLILDLTLEEIAACNVDKLQDRLSRGVINGNGDHR